MRALVALGGLLVASAGAVGVAAMAVDPDEERPGGDTKVYANGKNAFSFPAASLDERAMKCGPRPSRAAVELGAWGLGLIPDVNGHSNLLHDGRARNVSEAILWHGGEAEQAKQRFVQMSRDERKALVKFVESL